MPEEMDCKDGFCRMRKPSPEKKPEDIFFQPIEDKPKTVRESKQTEDSKMRKRFIQYCDDNPWDVECKTYDV